MWYDEEEEEDEGEPACSACTSTPENSASTPSGQCNEEEEEEDLVGGGGSPSEPPVLSPAVDLPHNLYLASPGVLGMGAPTRAEHIRNLYRLYNVRLVINLRDSSDSEDWFEGVPVLHVHLPVKAYCAPPLETLFIIFRLCALVHSSSQNKEEHSAQLSCCATTNISDERLDMSAGAHQSPPPSVAIHCLEGKGRTGTVCAAFLLYQQRHLTAEEAIAIIRARSPLSIESCEQEEFIHRFALLCSELPQQQEEGDKMFFSSADPWNSHPLIDDCSSMTLGRLQSFLQPRVNSSSPTSSSSQISCGLAKSRKGLPEHHACTSGEESSDEEDSGGWYCS